MVRIAFWGVVGRGVVDGVVVEVSHQEPKFDGKLKEILSIKSNEPCITFEQLKLCQFVSDYYFAPIGEVIKQCLAPEEKAKIKSSQILPPKLGQKDFGAFKITYKYPVYKSNVAR